jgi:hypothetical protein
MADAGGANSATTAQSAARRPMTFRIVVFRDTGNRLSG